MHPLLKQIRVVSRHARRLLLCRGAAWWACLFLAASFVAGCADYWLRYREQGLRWLATGSVATLIVWGWLRFVWPALSCRLSEEVVAHWIERRFPDLRDRLSSAVAFVRQPREDARFGSNILRQAVVQDATESVANRNLLDCLDSRAARRAGIALLLSVATIITVCATDVHSSTIAARRLAMPWREEVWPRRNWLVFSRSPHKLAAGQDFVAEVIDQRGWLPSDVTIWYWFDGDDQSDARSHPMVYAGGKMTHRLAQVTRSFRYRVVGGDDRDMAWVPLQVVELTRVVETQISLRPPPYSGLPEQSGDRRIRGLAGTEVEIAGRVNKPITSAELHFKIGNVERKFPAMVSGDGLGFRLPAESSPPWVLTESGTYGWALVDRDGVSGPLELHSAVDVLVDAPPTVAMESPMPNDGYTISAAVPLQVVVKDDLAVQRVVLQVGDRSEELENRSDPPAIATGAVWPPRGEQQTIEHVLNLKDISELHPGQTLSLRVLATDFKPQDGEAAEASISIISDEELKARIDQRQMGLLQRLNDTLRLQRTLRSQTKAIQSERVDPGVSASSESVVLPSVELGQHRVRVYLDGDGGAIQLVEQLVNQLTSNRVDDVQLNGHLLTLQDDLVRIARQLVPPIEQQLGQAAKVARLRLTSPVRTGSIDKTPTGEWNTTVSSALAGQDQVIESLEEIVDRLAQWSGYRLLAQEVAQIQNEQQNLLSETRTLPTAAQELIQLSADEKAKLRRLGDRQEELASQLDRLQRRLERMRQQSGDGDPLATATMDAALEVLREHAPNSQMREAARLLLQNRVGSAASAAEQSLDGLQRLYDALSQRPEHDLSRLADQLRALSREVETLRRRQDRAAQQAASAETLTGDERHAVLDRMAADERELAEAVQKLERRMRQLTEVESARRLAEAAAQMKSAGESAMRDDSAASAKAAREAARLLDVVQEQLARAESAAQQEQVASQKRYLVQALESLRTAQQTLLTRTQDLATQADGEGQLPVTAGPDASQLSAQQMDLAHEVSDVARRIDSVATFTYALERVANLMDRAANRLANRMAGQDTTDAQRSAIQRLQRLSDALADPTGAKSDPTAQPNQSAETDQSGPPSHLLAELKVLRGWQLDINRRTEELANVREQQKQLSTDRQRELGELAREQEKIAELIERLASPEPKPTKESLPTDKKSGVQDGLERALRKSGVPGFEEQKP